MSDVDTPVDVTLGSQSENGVRGRREQVGGGGGQLRGVHADQQHRQWPGALGVREGRGDPLGQPLTALRQHFDADRQPRARYAVEHQQSAGRRGGGHGGRSVGQSGRRQGRRLLGRIRRRQPGLTSPGRGSLASTSS
jgi:hypothetical protein